MLQGIGNGEVQPLKVFVFLPYGLDAAKYHQLFQKGLVPDSVPYGFHHAEHMGCLVEYSSDKPEGRVRNLIRRSIKYLLNFDLVHALRNRKQMFAADTIWTMSETEFLAAALLSLVYRKQTQIIGQTIFLFNRWSRIFFLKRWLLKKLMLRADHLTVHSQPYLDFVSKILPDSKPKLLPFGISLDSFPLNRRPKVKLHHPIRILSMGNDPCRDWNTFLDAFGGDERFDVVAINSKLSSDNGNVRIPRNPTMKDFLELYRWADLVVIPMKPNLYSGITVALEATAMGVPIVCSDTGGVSTYFNRDQALFVPVLSPEALREAVLQTTEQQLSQRRDAAQERFLREDYSSKGMMDRYIRLTRTPRIV
jgi:glycosyltransferase involved in cell wall biosynthesis